MLFKVIFPSGYNQINILNDNLDVNIITSDDQVYFGTLFTLLNLESLVSKYMKEYFWSTDMVIVKDLKKTTIRKAIEQIMEDGYLTYAFTNIGTLKKIHPNYISFETIKDMSL